MSNTTEVAPVQMTTSRYQAAEIIRESGAVPVRITAGHPRFRLGYELRGRLPCLYPGRTLLAVEDHAVFEAAYRDQLETVGVEAIACEIASLSGAYEGRGLVLLCFEDVGRL